MHAQISFMKGSLLSEERVAEDRNMLLAYRSFHHTVLSFYNSEGATHHEVQRMVTP